MYHRFIIQLSAEGHLGCLYCLAIVNRATNAGEVVRKKEPHSLLIGKQIGAASLDINVQNPQKTRKKSLPYDRLYHFLKYNQRTLVVNLGDEVGPIVFVKDAYSMSLTKRHDPCIYHHLA